MARGERGSDNGARGHTERAVIDRTQENGTAREIYRSYKEMASRDLQRGQEQDEATGYGSNVRGSRDVRGGLDGSSYESGEQAVEDTRAAGSRGGLAHRHRMHVSQVDRLSVITRAGHKPMAECSICNAMLVWDPRNSWWVCECGLEVTKEELLQVWMAAKTSISLAITSVSGESKRKGIWSWVKNFWIWLARRR